MLKFKKFKVEESIIVCGEPRSGTIWLLDLLAKIPNTFTNFEPLHQSYGVVPKKWKWEDRVFIPKENNTAKYYQFIKNVLTLKVYTKLTIRYWRQSISLLINSQFVITKFVRANLLLPYIVSNFRLKNKPILLLRHPIDTCLSQIKAFNHNETIIEEVQNQKQERYVKRATYLQSLTSELAYNVAVWCINNCPLLEDEETLQQLSIVYYSDLLLNPQKVMRQLLDGIDSVNKQEIDAIIASMPFREVSSTDPNLKKNFIANPEKQLQKNIANLSQEEKSEIQKVFDYFNFKLYDAYSVFPKKENLLTSFS